MRKITTEENLQLIRLAAVCGTAAVLEALEGIAHTNAQITESESMSMKWLAVSDILQRAKRQVEAIAPDDDAPLFSDRDKDAPVPPGFDKGKNQP